MYTFQSRVRYSELDAEGKLGISAIVDYFQDCSTFQAEALGVGLSYLKERGLVWVMSCWQIVIDRYPGLGDEITVGTFPYAFRGFLGYRNFFLEDAKGNRIVRANSIWTLMDLEAGRPARATDAMLEAYRMEPKLDMEYELRKVRLSGEGESRPGFYVEKQHLDVNRHVNNAEYIRMAQAYLPEGFEVGQMRAEYRKPALLHDRIVPVVYEWEERMGVSLENGEGSPFAVVEFAAGHPEA